MNLSSQTQIIGREILHFDTIGSTNDHALILLSKSNPIEGTVISADFQTGGKGQRNNSWQSDRNKNLLFSVILYPGWLSAARQFYLSMFASLAITTYLKTLLEPKKLFVKWPNDIYFDNLKLGGILIQNNLKGNSIETSVIGIGLNVNQNTFDPVLPNPASIAGITGTPQDIGQMKTALLSSLDTFYQQLLAGASKKIKNGYEDSLYKKGEHGVVIIRDQEFHGKILGVEEDGRLLMESGGKILKLMH